MSIDHMIVDRPAGYRGLRMTVDEFLQIPDDGYNYELVNGVVVLSPSPTPRHQAVAGEVFTQLSIFLRDQPIGKVLAEVDVFIGKNNAGQDICYRPEIVFLRNELWTQVGDRIVGAPDLIVEVISRGSRLFDTVTKKDDYERFGVGEYWFFDPDRAGHNFCRLEGGRFVTVTPTGDEFVSAVVPGFVLDLARVREEF